MENRAWTGLVQNHFLRHVHMAANLYNLVAYLPILTTDWSDVDDDEPGVGSVSSEEAPELVDFDPVRDGDDFRPDGPTGRATLNAPTGPSTHSTDSTAA